MKWFKRLFGKLTKQESQATKADEPVEAPAAVVEKAAEPAEDPVAEKAELPVEDAAPAAEPAPSDPAIARLDDERTAVASLAETTPDAEPDAKSDTKSDTKDEPATEIAEEVAAPEPVAEKPAEKPVPAPAEAPAPVTPATTAVDEGPFGPGSAKPNADGSAPGDEYTVKGKRSSKLFHTSASPYFGRTKADVWFKTPADAESAGFAAWNHKKKAPAK